MKNYKQFKKEILKDKDVRNAYKKLKSEFSIVQMKLNRIFLINSTR